MTLHESQARKGYFSGPVLVVEDNEINRTVITRMLKKLGYATEVAHHGQDGLQAWRAHRYRLIMMDCEMPVLNGYEATEAIRREEGHDHPFIVATTAYVSKEHRDRCVEAGMDVFVAKPVTLAKLREAIAKCEALAAERAAGRSYGPDESFELAAS